MLRTFSDLTDDFLAESASVGCGAVLDELFVSKTVTSPLSL